jgi:hypothetical protein
MFRKFEIGDDCEMNVEYFWKVFEEYFVLPRMRRVCFKFLQVWICITEISRFEMRFYSQNELDNSNGFFMGGNVAGWYIYS